MLMTRPPALHVLHRRLGGDEHGAQVDRHRAVEVLEAKSSMRRHHGDAGVVHQDVDAAELRRRALDRAAHGVGVGAVGLDGDACTPRARAACRRLVRLVGLADVGQRHVGAFPRQALDDGRADAAAAAGDQGSLVLQLTSHRSLTVPFRVGDALTSTGGPVMPTLRRPKLCPIQWKGKPGCSIRHPRSRPRHSAASALHPSSRVRSYQRCTQGGEGAGFGSSEDRSSSNTIRGDPQSGSAPESFLPGAERGGHRLSPPGRRR